MKAKELMIGDLVRIIEPDRYHGAICRIVSLINHKDDECGYFKVFILTKGNLLHEVCNEDIEPIPLTKEIVSANGFEEFCEMYGGVIQHRLYSEDRKIKIDVTNSCLYDLSCCPNVICELRYVHELQHALRLCGLNSLDDNFKI